MHVQPGSWQTYTIRRPAIHSFQLRHECYTLYKECLTTRCLNVQPLEQKSYKFQKEGLSRAEGTCQLLDTFRSKLET